MDARTQQPDTPAPLRFASFVIDPSRRSVERGDTVIPLTPKTWAVLYYLACRPDQVITKEEMLAAVWPETVVSETTLSTRIKKVRRALGDDARQPRFLKTVHGHGYQFVAPLVLPDGRQAQTSTHPPTGLVGRVAELDQLQQRWERAEKGQRQVVFVTGEAGIGKTTLVSAFVQSLSAESVYVGEGQCVEQYGMGEAYRPVLAALSQIGQGAARETLVEVLRAQAPSWLLHLPALLAPEERQTLATQAQGVTQTLALRELADALDVLAAHHPVVLVLEDLHWSDTATLAFLSVLARQPTPARVLVLGTYRPVDMIVANQALRHLKAELQLHALCQEIPLDYLTQAEVRDYVTHRLGETSGQLAAALHTRSEGNPLFLGSLVETLQRQSEAKPSADLRTCWEAVARVVPDQVQELIILQAEQLAAPEQAVVEAASVNGVTFSPTLVAAGLGQEPDEVEAICESLERQGRFLDVRGGVTWPDGTIETQYAFQHALHREALFQRVALGRRQRLHRAIGARLEAGYGEMAREVAAELALHFEQGREVEKAIQYYQLAGENALQRSAHQEAVFHMQKGLAVVETLPQGSARLSHELQLQTILIPGLIAIKGYAATEVEGAMLRARALCEQAGDTERLFFILMDLLRVYHARGLPQQAQGYAETCLSIAIEHQNDTFLLGAHYAMGANAFYQGILVKALTHWEPRGVRYDPIQYQTYTVQFGFYPEVGRLMYGAVALWLRGYPDQAVRQIKHTLGLEQELAHVFYACVCTFRCRGRLSVFT